MLSPTSLWPKNQNQYHLYVDKIFKQFFPRQKIRIKMGTLGTFHDQKEPFQVNQKYLWMVFSFLSVCLSSYKYLSLSVFMLRWKLSNLARLVIYWGDGSNTASPWPDQRQVTLRFYMVTVPQCYQAPLYRPRMTDNFQVGFINSDSELYSPDVDRGVETRTFNITDELGTIQHVFSGHVIKMKKARKIKFIVNMMTYRNFDFVFW